MTTSRRRSTELGIEAEVSGRAKHFYSIYKKMKRQGAIRADLRRDRVPRHRRIGARLLRRAGLVHSIWKPVPGRFKDYIAMPKPNMYQSLHTTVIGPRGEPLEIQIRTQEMHRIAEKGIAAHWPYKEGGKSNGDCRGEGRLAAPADGVATGLKDPKEFIETVKIDLFEDEVFVFTPKGDVKRCPRGRRPSTSPSPSTRRSASTASGAKVNGKIVPLSYQLKNGDIVEILTSNNAEPEPGLAQVSSRPRGPAARSDRGSRSKSGRTSGAGPADAGERAQELGVDVKEALKPEEVREVLKRYGLGQPRRPIRCHRLRQDGGLPGP